MTLVARTRRLEGDVDLLDVAGPDGVLVDDGDVGLAGHGEAWRGPIARVAEVLAGFRCDDAVGGPGTGPVAFAALPFASETSATAVIPSVVAGRRGDGTRWVTTIGEQPIDLVRPRATPSQPSSFEVTSARPPDEWCASVAAVIARIRAGDLTKAVLAREIRVLADAPIDVVTVLQRLRTAYPTTTLFSIDGLLGATPELLVSRFGDVVRSHPFAGTIPRTGDPDADDRAGAALLASAKEREEHQITIDAVLDLLLPFCSYVDYEPSPSVVRLANVQHLASFVEGRLSEPAASVLTLVHALHPTPAICGWPSDAARRLIDEHEQLDRGRYAGAVGWMDRNGDGAFSIAIRCAEIAGRLARLFAGMGIVADSDPATELAETRAKLQAVLSAIVRP